MPDRPAFVSFAPNHEDVVLWRALHDRTPGRYVELRPGTEQGLATAALYERGWDGYVQVLDATAAASHQATRHRDTVGHGARTPVAPESVGLGAPLHVLVVGPEDEQRAHLAELDPAALQPWVVLVDSRPDEDPVRTVAAEAGLAAAGYTVVLVDGISRFHLAPGHEDLAPALRHGACRRDHYVDGTAEARLIALTDDLRHWRGRAVHGWSVWEPPPATGWSTEDQRRFSDLTLELAQTRLEVARMKQTLSWRVTSPLRRVRRQLDDA